MGISSNQARFLALTSRQVDLENRVQQICQRRLRLSSELEKVATDYNNSIGNRKLYAFNTNNSGISDLSIGGIKSMKDNNGLPLNLVGQFPSGTSWIGASYSSDVTFLGVGNASAFRCYNDVAGYEDITKASLGLPNTATEAECLDAGLRAGLVAIAKTPDQYTQSKTFTVDDDGNTDYVELQDWRTLPVIADELYKGDDVDAENKYDRTVAQVNSQDKKLQLEQSSIEVEYKAVTSEKEAVKKILDTNAASSFKYFS